MTRLAHVSAEEVAKYGPSAKLWALMEHVARDPSNALPVLRSIWLIWAYDAEVNNGGHLQYFHNQGLSDVPATVNALREVGAEEHARLLEACWAAVRLAPVSRVGTLEEYAEIARTRSFKAEDRAFYSLSSAVDMLVQHKEAVLDELVEVEG